MINDHSIPLSFRKEEATKYSRAVNKEIVETKKRSVFYARCDAFSQLILLYFASTAQQ